MGSALPASGLSTLSPHGILLYETSDVYFCCVPSQSAKLNLTKTPQNVMAWFGIQQQKKDKTTIATDLVTLDLRLGLLLLMLRRLTKRRSIRASQSCPSGNLRRQSFSPATTVTVEKIDVGAVAAVAATHSTAHTHLTHRDPLYAFFFNAEATDQ
ncbi:hypothetical protein EYF80_024893 [Liparis tanakae]|uniref:Uncharacterized protein n=1 Tax=Liparis tanakae TaxID=230148 RepID=A0A4Z2HHZ9_9TELE|nr:hypothetical protein EYF80_024893 [Liparis tanakae]